MSEVTPGDDRWVKERSADVGARAARDHRRALGNRVIDVIFDLRQCRFVDQRTSVTPCAKPLPILSFSVAIFSFSAKAS